MWRLRIPRKRDEIETVAAEGTSEQIYTVLADVSSESACAALIQAAEARLGPADVLVNSASSHRVGHFWPAARIALRVLHSRCSAVLRHRGEQKRARPALDTNTAWQLSQTLSRSSATSARAIAA